VIIIICGPAEAGKSTLARRLQQRLHRRGLDVGLLDSDQFSRDTYEQLYERVEGSDEHWVIAGTFYKRKWQDRFADLPDVVVVYLKASLDTCLERNRMREDPISEQAIHVIWKEFEEPDADITITVDGRSPTEIVDRVMDCLETVAEQEALGLN